nr:hypothetical protein [Tanacetum cinerariifolium]
MAVLFKCRWFDLVQGVKVNVKHKLVDIKYRSRGCIYDPFILAYQAQQVYYATYPSMTKDLNDWWVVVKAMPRGIFQVAEGTTEDIQQVTLLREEIEEVQTALVTDDTNDNGEEEEFEDMNDDDDSSDDIDLDSSNHSSDDDVSIPTGRGGSSIVRRGREIANEWSPRGRGDNISSGNSRTYLMNGIIDDISLRGRGSTNRDISDDFSPIRRVSSSIGRRGIESVDEWCPGPNILGDEILDVHEDNEEHVEHVVGSSQNQVGSNVTPSSSLPKLWLIGGVFYDPAISRHAVRLFKTMFKGAYATWTKVPQDHRDRCFKRFEDEYSKIISKKNKENDENTEIDENGSKSPPDDFEVWKGVGLPFALFEVFRSSLSVRPPPAPTVRAY